MKKANFLLYVLTFATLLLSACGAAAATPTAGGSGGKVEALPVAFIGVVESMAGEQWVINGNTVTVDPAVVRDGPFNVGDRVKVEGVVNSDGSFAVSRVEPPTAADLSTLPQFGNDNSNANTNDANVNDGNVNDDNSNADNSNDANVNDGNGNDDNGNDANSNESNINDDNGHDGNSNDDNGGGNSNDSNGNDDHSGGGGDHGGGGGNDGGGDDSGSGGGNDD
jgi:uncharacterized membrane protein YgcG